MRCAMAPQSRIILATTHLISDVYKRTHSKAGGIYAHEI
jgi:hypothetical protein